MGSRISTGEWVALIVGTIVLDIAQVILTFMAIGLLLNRVIDLIVGIGLPAYFWTRGVSMNDWKRWASFIGAFGLEEIGLGGDDGLPLWTLEVIVVWLTVAAEKRRSARTQPAQTQPAQTQPLYANGRREARGDAPAGEDEMPPEEGEAA